MDTVQNTPGMSRSGPVWGYWVPEPALLVGPRTQERQLVYLTNWVRVRPAWLMFLQVARSRAASVGSQFWRSYLLGVPEDFRTDTSVGQCRIAVQQVFGHCFSDDRVHVDTTSPVRWHSHEFREVPPHLAPWVVWEAFELGFRYDLLALDRYVRRVDAEEDEVHREEFLSRIFPGRALLAVDELPLLDSTGLFASLPHRRIKALNALRDVVKLWPGCPAVILDSEPLCGTSTACAIVDMESALPSFYVNLFYTLSGRPPVVPHLCPNA